MPRFLDTSDLAEEEDILDLILLQRRRRRQRRKRLPSVGPMNGSREEQYIPPGVRHFLGLFGSFFSLYSPSVMGHTGEDIFSFQPAVSSQSDPLRAYYLCPPSAKASRALFPSPL